MNKRYKKELTIDELALLPEENIDTSEIPELDKNFWKTAKVILPIERGKRV